jgi:long-chain fatty acid transport protein
MMISRRWDESCRLRRVISGALFALQLLFAPMLSATNGYSPTGFGTANKGLAGAGVAFPQDSLAAATNPAGTFVLDDRFDFGAAAFFPERGFTANPAVDLDPFQSPQLVPAGNYQSENDLFLIPHFGWKKELDSHSAIGISVGGNGGMNTDYKTAIWQNFGQTSPTTGVDFSQLFIGLSYARELAPGQLLGIMPIAAIQRFEAKGLEVFSGLSVQPDKVSGNGHDYARGFGWRLGWLGQLNSDLDVGVSYQSRINMERFDKYAGLFAEQGDFDIPPTITIGINYKMGDALNLVADYQRIYFGDINALANSNGLPLTSPDQFLGADNGLGFGWEDMDILKVGIQWQYSPDWVLRIGASHASRLFGNREALFNVLAPATIRTHFSFGFSYKISKKHVLSLAYTHAFKERISGRNPNFTGSQEGSVEMKQDELEISWGIIL